MLLFSTILEINDTLTKDLFIQLVIEWNQGSPHDVNVIKNINWNGEHNIKFGDNNLWLDIEEYRNENIIAVRYEKIGSDGAVWDTDYVMNFTTMKMAIRLDRSFTEDALTYEKEFSTPHFITLLIDKGYVKDDNGLPVAHTETEITNDNIGILSDIINEKKIYKLPVVFVSKTFYDEDPVNVNILANRLKGVAHVLVQQSNISNNALRHLCDSKNEYYGAIGIYFTSPSTSHRRYLYHLSSGMDSQLLEKTIRLVIQHQNSQHLDALYTWQGVNNALLRDRLASQKEERAEAESERRKTLYELIELKGNLSQEKESMIQSAKAEADKILEAFDEDQQKQQEELDRLTHENERLQAENQGLKSSLDKINDSNKPILHMGEEDEFYSGEIRDLILAVLSEVKFDEKTHTRREDVIKDIISHNDYQKISKQNADEVKRLLNNYNGMTKPIRQSLEKMGFEITEEGKHYKICYHGDGRYQATLSKTPSDFRTGKNSVSQISKIAF